MDRSFFRRSKRKIKRRKSSLATTRTVHPSADVEEVYVQGTWDDNYLARLPRELVLETTRSSDNESVVVNPHNLERYIQYNRPCFRCGEIGNLSRMRMFWDDLNLEYQTLCPKCANLIRYWTHYKRVNNEPYPRSVEGRVKAEHRELVGMKIAKVIDKNKKRRVSRKSRK